MSPTPQPSSVTNYVPGVKPRYEQIRLTASRGRAFLGATGWNRAIGGGSTINLELDRDGLQDLITKAQATLALMDEQAARVTVQPAPVVA